MENSWTIEEAKNDFTAIAEAAYAGTPQYVTNRSHPDLVITAKSREEKQECEKKEENERFVEFLMSCPAGDIFPDGYEPSDIIEDGNKNMVSSPTTRENAIMTKKPSFKEVLFSIPKGEPFIDENGRDELKLRDVKF